MLTPPEPIDALFAADAPQGDRRLRSPAFARNGRPIVEALAPRLAEASGEVLEVGSGPGQHVALFALSFQQLFFQPSDPEPAYRASVDAWRDSLGVASIRPAIDLDASRAPWPLEAVAPERGYRAILCANVVHIAPWSVAAGVFRGAGEWLAPDGFLALYGPFRWHGRHIAASNEAFDASLRHRDADWGVRDVDDIDRLASANWLERIDAIAMPANNHLLTFERVAS